MPGVVEDYVKQEKYEAREAQEWQERYATERIPSWQDEERITARAYEEPREDQHAGYRMKAW